MSDMIALSRHERRNAEATLLELLPQAETLAKSMAAEIAAGTEENHSPMGETLMAHVGRDKLAGVHIHHRPPWGWYADVLLKDMPVGCASAFGRPMANPLASEAEARECAVVLVAIVLAKDELRRGAAPPAPKAQHFCFYDLYLPIPLAAIAGVRELARREAFEASAEECYARLAEIKAEIFGDAAVTGEAFAKLEDGQKLLIITGCSTALALHGIFRFPQWTPELADWKG
jgi:hypothetical protein